MESFKIKHIRRKYGKLLRNCKNDLDYEWFRNIIVHKLVSDDYNKRDEQYRLEYFLLMSDFLLKNYSTVEETLGQEDLRLSLYFKPHNINIFKIYWILCLGLAFFQLYFTIVSRFVIPNDLFFIGLLIVPLFIVSVSAEYCSVKIIELFPYFANQVLNGDCLIKDKKYRCYYLIKLFEAKAYREARMVYDNYIEHRGERIIIFIAIGGSVLYTFPQNFFLAIVLGLAIILTLFSLMRFKVGAGAAFSVCTIIPNKIKFNLYAIDRMGGTSTLFKIFGYTIFAFTVQFVFLITVYVISKNLQNVKDSELRTHVLSLIITFFAINLIPLLIDTIKSVCKSIFMIRFQRILKNRLYIQMLKILRLKIVELKPISDLLIWNNLQMSIWRSFRKMIGRFFKFSFFVFPLLVTIWASAYPSEIRLYFDVIWNWLF
jgi:hypothetical protein